MKNEQRTAEQVDREQKLMKLYEMDFAQMLTRIDELKDEEGAKSAREALRGARSVFMLALRGGGK